MNEKNEGYEIIAREIYSVSKQGQQEGIALGRNETMFVTWSFTVWPLKDGHSKTDYYWGHYFSDKASARADYHRRLLEKYEQ